MNDHQRVMMTRWWLLPPYALNSDRKLTPIHLPLPSQTSTSLCPRPRPKSPPTSLNDLLVAFCLPLPSISTNTSPIHLPLSLTRPKRPPTSHHDSLVAPTSLHPQFRPIQHPSPSTLDPGQKSPPTSLNDSFVAFHIPSPLDFNLKDHQQVVMTHWWLSTFLRPRPWPKDHQRVSTTRWWLSILLHPSTSALTTTNESSRLVGGFPYPGFL